MVEPTIQQVLARLDAQEARFAVQERELRRAQSALSRYRRRHRRSRHFLPLILVALLVALLPLSLLAANPFNDLTGGVHDPNIDAIYTAGVTTGCDPNVSYCPTANVTREEMASFLARLGGLGANPPVANAKTAQTATNATHATTADTATAADTAGNTAMLGGLPATAYAQKSQITNVAISVSGGASFPYQTGTFTPTTPRNLVFATGSAYRASAGAGSLSITISAEPVAGGNSGSLTLAAYTNEPISHKTLRTGLTTMVLTPGSAYRFRLTLGTGTVLDSFDEIGILVLGLP